MNTILKLTAVMEMTGLSRSSINIFEENGRFPQRVNIGGRAVGWVCAEVQEWIESKMALRERC